MVLVDTSVWVNHFRRTNPRLVALLRAEEVACHPLIVGEIACGGMRNRAEVLALLNDLPTAAEATHREVLHLIEERRLMGKGLGFIDMHLLACCLLSHVSLWTADSALAATAARMGIGKLAD